MLSKNHPKVRESDIIEQRLNGEVLIYDLKINKAYCLNSTSALIWELCDGNNSITEISKQLTKKMKSPVSEDVVFLAIEQLRDDSLLAESVDFTNNFEGLSRREVIRKVGLASVIALPVIAQLVAPTAAMSQSMSCVHVGGCTANGGSSGTNQALGCGCQSTANCASGLTCRAATAPPNQLTCCA